MAEGFLLGPNLLSQIRRTIDRVDGEPIGSGFRRTQIALEGEGPRSAKVFRICTFTGSWAIGETKPVEFRYQTTTPNTVNATNLFFPWATTSTGASTECAIAKDGTAWFLIDVPFETATAVFVGATSTLSMVSDVQIAAVLRTSDCTIVVSKTQSTASIIAIVSTFTSSFTRFRVT